MALPGDCPASDPCVVDECAVGVFKRILVDFLVDGGTRVAWELNSNFQQQHPGPLEYQLQVGRTANPLADDWIPIGLPAADTWFLIDDQKRIYGKTQWTHYRICVETGDGGTYISPPQSALDMLDMHDWRMALEIRRKELIRYRYAGQEGFLLKRKLYGQKCEECRDEQTDEIRDPDCSTCHGTGFIQGYFPPMPCIYADVAPTTSHSELDGGQVRGTINDVFVQSRMLSHPHMGEEDIWVSKKHDMRWYIHTIQNTAEIKGVPIISQVELRLAPFTDSIYSIMIPGQKVIP